MKIVTIQGKPDFSGILDLINTIWPAEFGPASDSEKIDKMNSSHNEATDCVKYLYDEDRIVGFYRYSLWPRDAKEHTMIHLIDIAIHPEKQKKGLGSLLLKDLIEECKEKGFEKILSRTFKTNEGSIRFHKSAGFTIHMETDDSVVWELLL